MVRARSASSVVPCGGKGDRIDYGAGSGGYRSMAGSTQPGELGGGASRRTPPTESLSAGRAIGCRRPRWVGRRPGSRRVPDDSSPSVCRRRRSARHAQPPPRRDHPTSGAGLGNSRPRNVFHRVGRDHPVPRPRRPRPRRSRPARLRRAPCGPPRPGPDRPRHRRHCRVGRVARPTPRSTGSPCPTPGLGARVPGACQAGTGGTRPGGGDEGAGRRGWNSTKALADPWLGRTFRGADPARRRRDRQKPRGPRRRRWRAGSASSPSSSAGPPGRVGADGCWVRLRRRPRGGAVGTHSRPKRALHFAVFTAMK